MADVRTLFSELVNTRRFLARAKSPDPVIRDKIIEPHLNRLPVPHSVTLFLERFLHVPQMAARPPAQSGLHSQSRGKIRFEITDPPIRPVLRFRAAPGHALPVS